MLPHNFDETIESIKQDLEALDGSPEKGTSGDADLKDQRNQDVLKKTVSLQSRDDLTQEIKAGFMLRVVAYTVDNVILYILSTVLLIAAGYFITGSSSLEQIYNVNTAPSIFYLCIIASIFVEMFYFTYFYGMTGQTVGKWICGIRVVGTDGKTIGFKRAFVRFCSYILSSLPLCLGFFWIIFDKEKQGWHDKIAGTYVVRVSK